MPFSNGNRQVLYAIASVCCMLGCVNSPVARNLSVASNEAVLRDFVTSDYYLSSGINTQICSPKRYRVLIPKVIAEWGRRSIEYDLAIIGLMDTLQGNRSFGQDVEEDRALDDLVIQEFIRRLKLDEQLYQQVFWDHRWRTYELMPNFGKPDPANDNEDGRVSLFVRDAKKTGKGKFAKFYWLMLLSGLTHESTWIPEDSDQIDASYLKCIEWFEDFGPYLVWDADNGIYQVDESAEKSKRPVARSKQEFTKPDAPLFVIR